MSLWKLLEILENSFYSLCTLPEQEVIEQARLFISLFQLDLQISSASLWKNNFMYPLLSYAEIFFTLINNLYMIMWLWI